MRPVGARGIEYWSDGEKERLFIATIGRQLVSVDAATGERVWHFQTVRHGIWDYDIASPPNLIDIVVDGKLIKAVAQVSKTGFTYVFDRATGEPVWPIEDRPVDHKTTVQGEKLAETQPFPTKPPYRTITAIDLNRGEHRWRIPVGAGPKNHPAIAHLNLDDMGTVYFGMPAEGGLLVTRTLLIGFVAVDEDGDRSAEGGLLRGYDKATGELLAEVETDIWLHGPPMTYMHQGRQYIVVAGGGARNRRVPDELIAFALPESEIGH